MRRLRPLLLWITKPKALEKIKLFNAPGFFGLPDILMKLDRESR